MEEEVETNRRLLLPGGCSDRGIRPVFNKWFWPGPAIGRLDIPVPPDVSPAAHIPLVELLAGGGASLSQRGKANSRPSSSHAPLPASLSFLSSLSPAALDRMLPVSMYSCHTQQFDYRVYIRSGHLNKRKAMIYYNVA
ncbi:hypothetical protein EYF80_044689 [Liparis tanakae]|uniref:Uncharacterized protein n=1 Tax=Liparis tanakae TaxID=230148 RepID=A0A4Z2FV18_9TELE|nr:hypothetical protein EYF80_044689 [Liparis tanakae]